MSPLELEKRVADLEAEMNYLKSLIPSSVANSLPWWDKIAGIYENSPVFDEAMELGNQYRRSLSANSTEEE
jgi:hypothetical protein